MPYYRSDDQFQSAINANWIKGTHNVRLGTDIYLQALNHTQPEISDGFGARGRFVFGCGNDAGSRRAERHQLQPVGVVPPRAARASVGRIHEVDAPYTTRATQYQRVRARSVAGPAEADAVVWHALGVLPGAHARRPRPGALQPRHQHDGDRRRRIGASRSGRQGEQGTVRAARRRGVPADVRPWSSGRGSASPTTRTRCPGRCGRTIRSCSIWSCRRRIPSGGRAGWRKGFPPSPTRISATGSFRFRETSRSRPSRSTSSAATSSRGTCRSRRSCSWGFVGEAAYVATRQIDQLGERELNWSPIGGGNAGRQLFQKFGRTAETRIVAPLGDSQYDSLQTSLRAPVRQRRPVGRQLHPVEVDRASRGTTTAMASRASTFPSSTT